MWRGAGREPRSSTEVQKKSEMIWKTTIGVLCILQFPGHVTGGDVQHPMLRSTPGLVTTLLLLT